MFFTIRVTSSLLADKLASVAEYFTYLNIADTI